MTDKQQINVEEIGEDLIAIDKETLKYYLDYLLKGQSVHISKGKTGNTIIDLCDGTLDKHNLFYIISRRF